MKYYCPYCNKEEEYYIEKRIFNKYKDVIVNIEEQVPICKKCKNELFINEIEDKNLKKIYSKYRQIKNLITPNEIINLRKKYNLSQRELTSILGFGKMTINRYENGALPSKSQSDYLKLISSDKNKFLKIAEESFNNKKINTKTFNKIKNPLLNNNKYSNLENYIEMDLTKEPNIYNGFKLFDIDKLQNLISYLASKVDLYLTSLNKYLWFIDIISFHERVISITGLTYIHEQFGPVIIDKKYEEISKLDDKFKREDIEKNDGSIISKIISKNNFDLTDFNDSELEIINFVIDKLKNKSVNEISELSHQEDGWKKTKKYEKISFEFSNNLKILE